MARIKNTSGQDRLVPWLGGRLVVAGAVVEVPAEDVTAYTQQVGTWAPADDKAQQLHDAASAPAEEVVEETPARDLIDVVIPTLDGPALAEFVEAEQARPKPRTTVLAAAEKRQAELDEDPDDSGTEPGHIDSQEG